MWPALLIIAASAFAKHMANQEAQGRQERFRQSMEGYQRTKAAESTAATEGLLQKQTPQARGDELAQVTADRAHSLRDTVGAAQAFDAAPIAGKMSGDYGMTQEATANRNAERVRRAIEQLSTIGAPGEQAQAFGRRFGVAAGNVDAANRASANVGAGYLTDIKHVKPDPFLSMAGDVGMTVGGAMAGNAAATAAADAGVNNGQGFEDASGNLYDPEVATRDDAKADARIQRQLKMNRAFGLWGL